MRFARVRLINDELDRLTQDASDRSTSVLNKASFLAVAAGVIIAASTAQRWDVLPIVGVIALGMASIGLVFAAIALRPGGRPGIVASRLVDRHLESIHSAAHIEEELVRDKTAVLEARETDIVARARWVWRGFAALILSTVSLTVVFGAEILGR